MRRPFHASPLFACLAQGAAEEFGKDCDTVEQRFALAMTYLILWARDGYR